MKHIYKEVERDNIGREERRDIFYLEANRTKYVIIETMDALTN